MVRKLAAARAQVDKTTTRGHTPLHYAAWGGAWRKGIFGKRVWTSEMAIVAISLLEYSQIVYYSRQPGTQRITEFISGIDISVMSSSLHSSPSAIISPFRSERLS